MEKAVRMLFLLGQHYFREAMRRGQNAEYIQQARIWLDRVIEWADGEDDQDAQTCTYAICTPRIVTRLLVNGRAR